MQELADGVVLTRIKIEGCRKKLVIVSVYNTVGWKSMEKVIKKVVEENKGDYIVIGGDFNARIGEKGGNNEEGWNLRRLSKNKLINERGKMLIDLVGEIGGYLLNGTTKGDEEGEFTFVGVRGCSVSD